MSLSRLSKIRCNIFISLIQSTGYHLLTSGASCEARSSGRITSLAECQTASQQLGLSVGASGTVDAITEPSDCYHRFDGDLWYNTNRHSTAPCNMDSRCICKIGKYRALVSLPVESCGLTL